MNKYNILSLIDNNSNYGTKEEDLGNPELAEYINKNYDKMTPEEMKYCAIKCLSNKDIRRILLTYEFDNIDIKPVKHMTLDVFIKKTETILNRYQHKVGGFDFEDNRWIFHREGSKDYPVNEYTAIVENSISIVDIDNKNTEVYLDRLNQILNNIADNIDVDMEHQYNYKDKIVWVQLLILDKNKYIDVVPNIEL